jgi:hypothetical protein
VKTPLLVSLVAGLLGAQSALPRKDIPGIAKAANGAVVSIIMSDKDGHPIAQGSGFLVSKDGLIVTNYHVVHSGSAAIVKLPDGAFFAVDGVLAFDKVRDIAVIKAHGDNFRTVTLGDSDRIQVGEEVVAIGNPLSLESTVSTGIVSGVRTAAEEGGKFLQVTAPISPGSSGGPLFNEQGEVIGITTLYIKGGENLNFAIPINDAKRLLSAKSSRVYDFPNETNGDAGSSTGFLSRKEICLDGMINTVETGPFTYLPGRACTLFVVRLPLTAEDAQLLEGRSPEDDGLLGAMEIEWGNAIEIQLVIKNQQSAARSIESGTPQLIGAIWSSFEKNRDAFCSRHPTMFVFDMKIDGTETPPAACSEAAQQR